MGRLATWLSNTLEASVPASAATTAVVSLCGQAENGNPIAPLNAISHILWGDEAAAQDDASISYTATGVALNTAAVASWAGIYEATFGPRARRGDTTAGLVGGAVIAAAAYVTDYYIVPRRLTPGFEKRLSPASMLAVYTTLALSLPVASIVDGMRSGNGPASPPRSRDDSWPSWRSW
jgi:hypothetical protein